MMYEKAVKSVKDLGAIKKQQIILEKKIQTLKQDIEVKRTSLEKQDKQKQSLINLYNTLKEKNLEAHKHHDQAIQHEQEEKTKMSNTFKKKINDISEKLQ